MDDGVLELEEVDFLMLGIGSDGHKGKVQELEMGSSPLLKFDPCTIQTFSS